MESYFKILGFIRQGYQKNIHYPKPVKYYTIDISRYGQDVVVAYSRDVELTTPMRAMIMQMKDAAEDATVLPRRHA